MAAMGRTSGTLHIRTRWLALVLACALLWLGTGAALHHTDDLSGLRVFAAHRAGAHALSPAQPAVPCAACEWEQTLPLAPATDTPRFAPAFARTDFAASLASAPCLRLRLPSSPRAPPAG